MAKDYAVVYDSTMARFWFFNDHARRQITKRLQQVPQGRIVPDAELEELGTLFPDRYFGELIFLVQEGVLIVPSHMGERPIRAMHGYHPSDPQSYAVAVHQSIRYSRNRYRHPRHLPPDDAGCAVGQGGQPHNVFAAYLTLSTPMDCPFVSIILRSFNEGWALKETLPAVQAQDTGIGNSSLLTPVRPTVRPT